MKKTLIAVVLLLGLGSFHAQAQSTASGVSNTGNPTADAKQPAQNGSTGASVESAGANKSGRANQQKSAMSQSTSSKSKTSRMRKTKSTSGQ